MRYPRYLCFLRVPLVSPVRNVSSYYHVCMHVAYCSFFYYYAWSVESLQLSLPFSVVYHLLYCLLFLSVNPVSLLTYD